MMLRQVQVQLLPGDCQVRKKEEVRRREGKERPSKLGATIHSLTTRFLSSFEFQASNRLIQFYVNNTKISIQNVHS